jgi:succinate dehydrogenase flavin-adding protein (antitoxin of CptAB toxin-antitoxin module)|tara:strand:+ start:203 stop:439 length:237 start_codon:yes stop_codon:yes gene_type:complete
MEKSLLIKQLNFKARRGMKETSRVVRNLLDQIEDMSDEDLLELKKFIDLDDQKMFDYIFKHRKIFFKDFSKLKKYFII